MAERTCSIPECAEPVRTRGFCQTHYKADHYRRNIDKHRANREAWVSANADRKRELDARYYQQNRDKIKARAAAWRKANPERARAVVDAWMQANPERRRQVDQAYRAANAERLTIRAAAYYRAHPELSRAAHARRYARKLGRIVRPADYAAILERHGMVCHICGRPIASMEDLHFDHVVPLAKGGEHSAENIRPSHARCNLQKGPRLLAG